MKFTLDKDGNVEFDVDSAQDALDIIEELQRRKKAKDHRLDPMNVRLASLNKSQRETYNALLEFDSEAGVHVASLATLLETSEGAVSHRLSLLIDHELVKRVSRGHYRAIPQ
jgi:predicted transcriptional regulator